MGALIVFAVVLVVALIVMVRLYADAKKREKFKRGDYADVVASYRRDIEQRKKGLTKIVELLYDRTKSQLERPSKQGGTSITTMYAKWLDNAKSEMFVTDENSLIDAKDLEIIRSYHPNDNEVVVLISDVKKINNLLTATFGLWRDTASLQSGSEYAQLKKTILMNCSFDKYSNESDFAKAFVLRHFA
ncbi:MAG: hypothetical protein FWF81_12810 [Defluviitaleaceae bacterium]|nr:hypothetical protein [Defluviitaleaceae bacterium]